MINYYLIDTWNGQGYSDSGIIDIVDTIEDAKENAWIEFQERYLININPNLGHGHHEVIFDDEGLLYADEQSSDSGKITILQGDFDGMYINPDIHDCVGMNMDDYNKMLKFLSDNSEEDEYKSFEEQLGMIGNAGIHTSEGFYIIYNLT